MSARRSRKALFDEAISAAEVFHLPRRKRSGPGIPIGATQQSRQLSNDLGLTGRTTGTVLDDPKLRVTQSVEQPGVGYPRRRGRG
jgi:hypothetical protein